MSPDLGGTSAPAAPTRVDGVGVLLFTLTACALAWIVSLPLWAGDGLSEPGAPLLLPVMMYTPAAAALLVALIRRTPPAGRRARYLGLWPLRPARRIVGLSIAALLLPLVLVAAATLVAAAFGWIRLDLVGFSGFTELLRTQIPANTPLPPPGVLVFLQLLAIPLAAATVNALAAFGEELGWRGYLVPALRPLGTWPTLLISGAIWGVWHAPIILLGYNFGRTDITGVLLMVAGCVAWGVLLGWLRLRSGSLWPAVFAHGALNAAAGMPVLLLAAGTETDPALSGVLGAAGWIVCVVVVAVLVLAGQFRRQPGLVSVEEEPGAAG